MEYEFKDVSIDNLVFGIKGIDKDGNESLVSAYVAPQRRRVEIEPERTASRHRLRPRWCDLCAHRRKSDKELKAL